MKVLTLHNATVAPTAQVDDGSELMAITFDAAVNRAMATVAGRVPFLLDRE